MRGCGMMRARSVVRGGALTPADDKRVARNDEAFASRRQTATSRRAQRQNVRNHPLTNKKLLIKTNKIAIAIEA